ncbi:MAG: pyridoxal-phosphate dependent enzyme [Gemmatimonadetes bacterium]|nr:pyridoxal-phosphate dependent enzyme [Gemmatimonadota bacterium]
MTPPRVTLERVALAARTIDPVFLRSPQFECEPLSDALGARLSLKIESVNPIRSFKGRGADWLVSRAERGAPLVCASAGNFGQAMAWAGRARGVPVTVYASAHANPLKLERMRQLGATLVLHGDDFDAAKQEARRVAAARGHRFVEDGYDVETLEGAGTIALEWLERAPFPDVLLVPLGNGALFNGVATVVKARRPQTRLIAVQAAGAPAMVESWRAGRVIEHDALHTIADGIGVRVPIPQALDDLRGLADDAILVREASILAAMRLLHRHTGLVAEPSAAVGVAALVEQGAAFRGQSAGTIICGSNLTPQQMQEWL